MSNILLLESEEYKGIYRITSLTEVVPTSAIATTAEGLRGPRLTGMQSLIPDHDRLI
jgi:hypothetical protein